MAFEDVIGKSDDELVSVIVNRNDYVPEFVAMVQAELGRRGVDTSGLAAAAVSEGDRQMQESDRARVIRSLRWWCGIQMFCVAVVAIAVVMFERQMAMGVIPVCLMLLILYVAAILLKQWAITTLLALSMSLLVLNVLGSIQILMGRRTPGGYVLDMLVPVGISVVLVLFFLRMRRLLVKRIEPRGFPVELVVPTKYERS